MIGCKMSFPDRQSLKGEDGEVVSDLCNCVGKKLGLLRMILFSVK